MFYDFFSNRNFKIVWIDSFHLIVQNKLKIKLSIPSGGEQNTSKQSVFKRIHFSRNVIFVV
jgi:hypothetical protein